jgi:hypothetical protein
MNQQAPLCSNTRKELHVPKSRAIGLLLAACSAVAAYFTLLNVANAALGEREATVQADAQAAQGSLKMQDRGTYRMQEIVMPSGTKVHEFVSLAGHVFAVTWQGPTMPNLRQTLGKYFDDYVAAEQVKHPVRRHIDIHRDDLVVESAGHMRAFAGRAYLPQAVPSGVNVGDLQ